MSLLITCESSGIEVPAEFLLSPMAMSGFSPNVAIEPSVQDGPHPRVSAEHLSQLVVSADYAGRYAADRLSEKLNTELIVNRHSMELIDVTRSLHHRQLFSRLTRSWPSEARQQLIDHVYTPYRDRVRSAVQRMLSRHGFLVHLSVRSFGLRDGDKIRRADVGLLYDPSREDESDFCHDWVYELWHRAPMLKVRRNYPRRGTSDSLTRRLRGEFSGQNYLGIEVLLNRAWASREVAIRDEAIEGICDSLRATLEETEPGVQAA